MSSLNRGRPIKSHARQIIYNVLQFMKNEAQEAKNKVFNQYHFQNVMERTAQATGVSRKTVGVILKEKDSSALGASTSSGPTFSTPKKGRAAVTKCRVAERVNEQVHSDVTMKTEVAEAAQSSAHVDTKMAANRVEIELELVEIGKSEPPLLVKEEILEVSWQGKDVVKKWRGLKDNLTKYEKKIKDLSKSGAGAKKIKQYHFYKQLLFLKKNTQNATISSIIEDEEINSASTAEQQGSQKTAMTHYQPAPRKSNAFEEHILQTCKAPINRHLSFFKGILPSVEKLNDDQTLIFQSRVLQILTDLQQPSWHYNLHTPLQSAQTSSHSGHQTSTHNGYQASPPSSIGTPNQTVQPPNQPVVENTIYELNEDCLTNGSSTTQSDYDFS